MYILHYIFCLLFVHKCCLTGAEIFAMECKTEDDCNNITDFVVHDHPYAGMSAVSDTVFSALCLFVCVWSPEPVVKVLAIAL